NLGRAARIVEAVFGASLPPSEAHFLLVLDRDLPSATRNQPQLVERVRLALVTRQLAEEVGFAVPPVDKPEIPASELVFPWLADDIAKADIIRLRGEDLLFSTESADWLKAEKLLNDASDGYNATRAKQAQIRLALNTRDRILAELPFLARWVAGLHDEFQPARLQELLGTVETIAREAHQLSAALADVSFDHLVAVDVAKLGAAFDRLKQDYFERTAGLHDEARPANWHRLDNALNVPLLEQKARERLLKDYLHVSRELNSKTGDASNVSTATASAGSAAIKADEAARRQGRM